MGSYPAAKPMEEHIPMMLSLPPAIITLWALVAALFTQSVWRPRAGDGDERGPGPGAAHGGDDIAGDGPEREALLCGMPPGAEPGAVARAAMEEDVITGTHLRLDPNPAGTAVHRPQELPPSPAWSLMPPRWPECAGSWPTICA